MKKQLQHLPTVALLFLAMCLLISVSFAQAPNGFNYQAAIRNADGSVRNNESVSLEFSILNGSATGAVLYKETQVKTTTEFGMVDHVIGSGVRVSGNFATINWGVGSKFLKIDLNTGSSLVTISNQKLQSVPYALFANETAVGSGQWNANGNNIFNKNSGNVGIGTNNPTAPLSFANGVANKKISLYDALSNDHQFVGLGTDGGIFRYQVDAITASHVFYSAVNASASVELMRIQGDGNVRVGDLLLNTAGIAAKGGLNDRLNVNSDGDIKFQTNIAGSGLVEAMDIRANGNVGIGTSNPQMNLEIAHGGGSSATPQGFALRNTSHNNRWNFWVNDNFDFSLYYNGSTRGNFSDNNGAYSSISDKRLKENFAPSESLLPKLLKLEIQRYNFIADSTKEKQIGLIAQDALAQFPEFVTHIFDANQDLYLVNYAGFSMVAIKAIQEQQVLIENLSLDKESLEDRILKLEKAILEMNQSSK